MFVFYAILGTIIAFIYAILKMVLVILMCIDKDGKNLSIFREFLIGLNNVDDREQMIWPF